MRFAEIDYDSIWRDIRDSRLPVPCGIVKAFRRSLGTPQLGRGYESENSIHLDFNVRPGSWRWSGLALACVSLSYYGCSFDQVRNENTPAHVLITYDFHAGLWDDLRTERILRRVANDLTRDEEFRQFNRLHRAGICRMSMTLPYLSPSFERLGFVGNIRLRNEKPSKWRKRAAEPRDIPPPI